MVLVDPFFQIHPALLDTPGEKTAMWVNCFVDPLPPSALIFFQKYLNSS
jgi:hypothetical protein